MLLLSSKKKKKKKKRMFSTCFFFFLNFILFISQEGVLKERKSVEHCQNNRWIFCLSYGGDLSNFVWYHLICIQYQTLYKVTELEICTCIRLFSNSKIYQIRTHMYHLYSYPTLTPRHRLSFNHVFELVENSGKKKQIVISYLNSHLLNVAYVTSWMLL